MPHAPAAQGGSQYPADYDLRSRIDDLQAANQPFYVGPACFGPRIRAEEVPKGFKIPPNLKTYDGVAEPKTWLDDFFNVIKFAGGTPNITVQCLPLVLVGTARQWLQDLLEKSINTWFDLRIAFIKKFQGTYRRPHTAGDLQRCTQDHDESSRDFLARWLDMKNSCEGITDETAFLAFIQGLERGTLLRHKLTRKKNEGTLTLNEMITVATSHAAADDDARQKMMATAVPA